MKVLSFSGASDDQFLIDSTDSIDCYKSIASVKLSSKDGEILVVGYYLNDTWMLGVAQVSEESPIPHWKIKTSQGSRSYSPKIEITCPLDTVIIKLENRSCHV